MAPTLAHCVWLRCPPGGLIFPWGGPAGNQAPTLAHCVWLRCPPGGAFPLGAARREIRPPRWPTACGCAAPRGEAHFPLGRPGGKTCLLPASADNLTHA